MNSTFDRFIEQLSIEAAADADDWTAVRKEWIGHLERFYAIVEEYLAEYIAQGKVHIEYEENSISEEKLGTYAVLFATISIVSRTVRLEPVGANLIGARGRVDMTGPFSKVTFLLVNRDATKPKTSSRVVIGERTEHVGETAEIELAWKLATPPPNIRYVDLDQAFFLETLMEVVNG